MRYLQSFYAFSSSLVEKYGWLAPEYHLMSWTLSCLLLKKHYNNIELYTNRFGKKILIDYLKLPYNKVSLDLEDIKVKNRDHFVLSKLYVYKLQDKPFLHVDGDVYILKKLTDTLLSKDIICQNIEIASGQYNLFNSLYNKLSKIPKYLACTLPISAQSRSLNAGVLGGNNIKLIKRYSHDAIAFYEENIHILDDVNAQTMGMVCEQKMLYDLAHSLKTKIFTLFNQVYYADGYTHMSDFFNTNGTTSYIHLLGDYKKDPFNCVCLAKYLRYYSPEYYYKIIHLIKKRNYELQYDYYFQFKKKDQETFKLIEYLDKSKYIFRKIELLNSKKTFSESKGFIDFMYKNKFTELLRMFFVLEKQEKYKTLIQAIRIRLEKFIIELSNKICSHSVKSHLYYYGRDFYSLTQISRFQKYYYEKIFLKKDETCFLINNEYYWFKNELLLHDLNNKINNKATQKEYSFLIIRKATKYDFDALPIDEIDSLLWRSFYNKINARALFDIFVTNVDMDTPTEDIKKAFEIAIMKLIVGKVISIEYN